MQLLLHVVMNSNFGHISYSFRDIDTFNNAKHSETKLSWFSNLLRHSARKEVGLFYNAPEPTRTAIKSLE